ncbi:hypothetical protein SDRG_05008 [Saprolegnia diclina VS20]|uniref:PH domain-containing protein n=1 Tax=Saprolegnia diclina (strain VS20) TaxID=1156394 RepID=T0QHH6_SAPDV|nr:hypothetical protein SDRG_05008 [Saprolegnia diclina VS20]EQC37404.1 hypothetical protein SDRG_05008 [Saprolegnia diclina VS20]|eukprot:XP_008608924.1 hypothetical protein SDRG_05008 [Saprolegnia diclina VS20]
MKSGKLSKHSVNVLGAKWSDKWVHLDAHALRWYPMVADAGGFSLHGLCSSKATKVLLLHEHTLVAVSAPIEKRLQRKHCFQLVDKHTEKTRTFGCASERDLVEWVAAIHASMHPPSTAPTTHTDQRCADARAAFAKLDGRGMGKIECAKLRALLDLIHWHGSIEAYNTIQQSLDPGLTGKIALVDFLDWVASSKETLDAPVPEPQPDAPPPPCPVVAPKKADCVPVARPSLSEPSTQWNDRLWRLLAVDDLSVSAKALQVAQLTQAFRDAAEGLVRTLLDTRATDVDDVFSANNIWADGTGDRHRWYGYADATDADVYVADGLCCFLWRAPSVAVWKALGHDLRAGRAVIDALQALEVTTLRVPLQCTVDYHGARALIFGDYGASPTVCQTTELPPTFVIAATAVLKQLNLCPPELDATDVTALQRVLPRDAHVVRLTDDAYAWTRLRHLCAPDVLEHDDGAHDGDGASSLHQLRPEYIRQYHTALSSNVYGTGSVAALDSTVACASHYLQKAVLPSAVARLEANEYFHVVDATALTRLLHGDGINMRYLGRLYELATLGHIRRLLLTEMVARTAKVLLRGMLRGAPASRSVVLTLVNLVCGGGTEAGVFLDHELLPTLRLKFGLHAAPTRNDVHLPQVLFALEKHLGVTVALRHIASAGDAPGPFRAHHIVGLHASTSMVLRTTTESTRLIASTDDAVGAGLLSDAVAYVKLALALEEAHPTDHNRVQWCHLLVCAAELSARTSHLSDADTFASAALEDGPRWHAHLAKAHTVAMTLAHAKGDVERIGHLVERAVAIASWHLGPTHVFLVDIYMTAVDVWCDRGEHYKALGMCDACLGVLKETFGRKSAPFVEVRRTQAWLVDQVGAPDEALSLYEECLRLYEAPALSSLVASRADCCLATAQLLLSTRALQPAYTTALQAHALCVEASTNVVASLQLLGECASAVDDTYRAIEYLTAAWAWVKDHATAEDDTVEAMQDITRRLVGLHRRVLSPDDTQVVDDVRRQAIEVSDDELAFVAGQLFVHVPGEYFHRVLQAVADPTDDLAPSAEFASIAASIQLNAMIILEEMS